MYILNRLPVSGENEKSFNIINNLTNGQNVQLSRITCPKCGKVRMKVERSNKPSTGKTLNVFTAWNSRGGAHGGEMFGGLTLDITTKFKLYAGVSFSPAVIEKGGVLTGKTYTPGEYLEYFIPVGISLEAPDIVEKEGLCLNCWEYASNKTKIEITIGDFSYDGKTVEKGSSMARISPAMAKKILGEVQGVEVSLKNTDHFGDQVQKNLCHNFGIDDDRWKSVFIKMPHRAFDEWLEKNLIIGPQNGPATFVFETSRSGHNGIANGGRYGWHITLYGEGCEVRILRNHYWSGPNGGREGKKVEVFVREGGWLVESGWYDGLIYSHNPYKKFLCGEIPKEFKNFQITGF